jgi:plastocyanin
MQRLNARSSRRLMGAIALVASCSVAAGCSSTSPSSSTAPPQQPASSSVSSAAAPSTASATITIANFAFGAPLTVKPGQKIQVVNNDSAPHTVTADDGHSFDAQASPSSTGSFTAPTTPGTYKFHCSVHPNMHGSLVVKTS